MKKGFTLLELIVVIGIIGVLAGIMLSTFGGSTANARATQCMANLRNLAVASQNLGMESGWYPRAGSSCNDGHFYDKYQQYLYQTTYGWISWVENSPWVKYEDSPWESIVKENHHTSKQGSKSMVCSAYLPAGAKDDGERLFAITNGALWKYAGKNRQGYVCPEHRLVCNKQKVNAGWSYVLNGYFGYDTRSLKGNSSKCGARGFGSLNAADRTLLFAELPFVENAAHNSVSFSTGSGDADVDCTLQFDDGTASGETVGFNHKQGNRYVAHMAFADGHVEKMAMPTSFDSMKAKELTKWLCTGTALEFDGVKYDKAD